MYRPSIICAVVICLSGCYKPEKVHWVKHEDGLQRQAGESAYEAAYVVRQSQSNSDRLARAMQSGDEDQLLRMRGKLVKIEGDLTDQANSIWTLKKNDWTILAPVSDRTPYANVGKSRINTCAAQGIVKQIDPQNKKIVLGDVELAIQLKSSVH